MKKFLSILISAVIISGCAFALAACGGKPTVEQHNNMTVKSISQNAYGSVNVTVEVSGVDVSAENSGSEEVYSIQPSLDGGQSWCNSFAQIVFESGEVTFTLAEYSSGDGAYYLFGSRNDETKLNLSAGDKIDVALRLAAHDNYLASEATTSVEYTVKSVTEIDFTGNSVFAGSVPIVSGTRYIFEKQNDGSFVLFKVNEDSSELETAETDISDRLEYKFITQNDLEKDSMSVIKTELKELENSAQTSGWIAYSAENGITDNEYKDSLISVERTDGVNNIEEEYALVMVRLKETDGETKSAVSLVTLFTKNEWTEIN